MFKQKGRKRAGFTVLKALIVIVVVGGLAGAIVPAILTLAPQSSMIYPKMPGSFPAGMSETLLYAIRYMNCGRDGGSKWSDPGNNAIGSPTAATFGATLAMWQQAPTRAACDPISGTAISFATDAIQIAMCDASVRVFNPEVAAGIWVPIHLPEHWWPDWVE